MCGIVGLFLKDQSLESELGGLLVGMLTPLGDRGPDSAGFAIYGAERKGGVKLTLRAAEDFDFVPVIEALSGVVGEQALSHRRYDTHLVVTIPADHEATVRRALRAFAMVDVVGSGRRMELFKEVGRPESVARRFGLAAMAGTHAIGHTRMATESAVTTEGAHPFSTGSDQCLVHNGSLSNHNAVRRKLIRQGLHFQTENDYRSRRRFHYLRKLREGRSLERAHGSLARFDLDGFYTFVSAPRPDSACCATRSPASRRSWPKRSVMSRSAPSTARWSIYPGIASRASLGAGARKRLSSGNAH